MPKKEWLPKDPLAKLKPPKYDDVAKPTFGIAKIETLFNACTRHNKTPLLGLRDRAIMLLLFSTGLRSAELVGLRVDDLDYDQHHCRATDTAVAVPTRFYGAVVDVGLSVVEAGIEAAARQQLLMRPHFCWMSTKTSANDARHAVERRTTHLSTGGTTRRPCPFRPRNQPPRGY